MLISLALVLSLIPASPALAATVNDYPVIWSNFNASSVSNEAEYFPDFTLKNQDYLIQAVSTYHWNSGMGAKPGTISIYDWDDHLIGTWSAVGRSGSGSSNVYWDAFPNVVLKAGTRYYIVDSDPNTWSTNSQAEQTGFAEVRGKPNTGGSSAQKKINVNVSGTLVRWTDAEPFIDKNSRTMVPLRVVAEALGLQVDWNGASREAIFTNGTKTIIFPIDSKRYRTETGAYGTMDTAAVIVSNRTYAPIRYLAEYFGYTVTWDGSTRTVGITAPQAKTYRWVLTKSEYKLNSTDNEYSTIDYTYLGVVDGMVKFKRTGGYNFNGKYALCDGTYSCQAAPDSIPAGSTLGLKMNLLIENYAWKNDGRNSVHIGELWIRVDTYTSFENSKGESSLKVGTDAGGPYTDRNVDLTDTYYYKTPDSTSVGSKMEFGFHCEAGTYTWYYELQAN